MKAEYDSRTKKWFRQHPKSCTTVMKCKECGLYYKPLLDHKCKEKRGNKT